MADIYDIFSKKQIKQPRATTYRKRYIECLKRIEENGVCDCDLCKDKKILSNRLFDIVRYLSKDYTEKTGKELYVADALEIVLIVAAKLKKEIQK